MRWALLRTAVSVQNELTEGVRPVFISFRSVQISWSVAVEVDFYGACDSHDIWPLYVSAFRGVVSYISKIYRQVFYHRSLFSFTMRLVDQDANVIPAVENSGSPGSTPTLSSVSIDDEEDPFDDPELTRMHFEGIERGEAEMQAQNDALSELSLALLYDLHFAHIVLVGMLTSEHTAFVYVIRIIDYCSGTRK